MSFNPIRVFIIDDHPIVRQGLRSVLSAFHDISIVGEADSPCGIDSAIQELKPQVILLDIRLGNFSGINVAHQLQRTFPDSRIIILSSYSDEEYVLGALEAGAYAYLLKDMSLDELPDAIRAVSQGQRLISPTLLSHVLEQFQKLAEHKAQHQNGLNPAEQQILLHAANGLTNRDIATQLNFSEANIKKKLLEILNKLGATNRTQAVATALRRNMI